ncbi:hypothetical protein QAD02_013858 [Eretmocerus hayati]|uniref:Uncharacterized protein n=1 Tax=Eretmocerus hayati TaxID=131215 RepID=A0ACC2P5F1_9HYME|nr:hypothetical protein QAD02_013858 [Eretmocerus hayati]
MAQDQNCERSSQKKSEGNQAIQENSSEVVEYDQVECQCQGGNRILNSGMGNLNFNKISAGLNIPQFQFTTMRTYEREVGNMTEKIARDSCDDAVLEERRLRIENAVKLKVLL